MATAIRWFSVFRKKTGIPTFSQLRWEMLGLGGEDPRYLGDRAAEWVSDRAYLLETRKLYPSYRPDGGWGLWSADPIKIGHTYLQVASSIKELATLSGATVRLFQIKEKPDWDWDIPEEAWYSLWKREIDISLLTERIAAHYWAATRRREIYLTVEITASVTTEFRINSVVGFLYPESQIKKRFLSDCWSGRNQDGSLSAARPQAEWDTTVSWHSECFVQGRPTGVVLGQNPCLDQAWVKKVQSQARALALMNGLPLYGFAEGRRDAAGLRRIN